MSESLSLSLSAKRPPVRESTYKKFILPAACDLGSVRCNSHQRGVRGGREFVRVFSRSASAAAAAAPLRIAHSHSVSPSVECTGGPQAPTSQQHTPAARTGPAASPRRTARAPHWGSHTPPCAPLSAPNAAKCILIVGQHVTSLPSEGEKWRNALTLAASKKNVRSRENCRNGPRTSST